MAWSNNSAAIAIPVAQVSATAASVLPTFRPFDATLYEPMVKATVAPEPVVQDVPIVDERQRDREEVKQNLQGIMRNRLLSETARVAAARELTRIFDNEEIAELREEVKRLTEITEFNAPTESELPPHLRRKR